VNEAPLKTQLFCIFGVPCLFFIFKGDKMLIISRKRDEKIIIADDIEITILEVGRNRVRFGIKAPKHIPIQTRLKTSPAPETSIQPIDMEEADSRDRLMPAVVGFSRRR